MYTYQIIDPRNPHITGNTLGIEVTVPHLAQECDLGNIDEQHRHGGGRAAIDVALEWPLPKAGSTLATIRPDLDAVGAMAVLALRVVGWEPTDAELSRIRDAAKADAFVRGEWSPRQVPTIERPWTDAGPVEDRADLAAVNAVAHDHALPLFIRVAVVAAWILEGMSASYQTCSSVLGLSNEWDAWRRGLPRGRESQDSREIAVRHYWNNLACGIQNVLEDAQVRVRQKRLEMLRSFQSTPIVPNPMDTFDVACAQAGARTTPTSTIWEDRGVAVVQSRFPGAIGLGYCLAPVVVAENLAFRWPSGGEGRKLTVAFFAPPSDEDYMRALVVRMNREEAVALCDQADLMGAGGGGCFVRGGESASDAIRREREDIAREILLSSTGDGWVDEAWVSAQRTRILDLLENRGGWGGNLKSGIIGSPQGYDSAVSVGRIVEIITEKNI